jgi:hypothetical protein
MLAGLTCTPFRGDAVAATAASSAPAALTRATTTNSAIHARFMSSSLVVSAPGESSRQADDRPRDLEGLRSPDAGAAGRSCEGHAGIAGRAATDQRGTGQPWNAAIPSRGADAGAL